MDNFNGFPATYQPYQQNWYYSPTSTTPVYTPRQQYQSTTLPSYQQNQNAQQQVNGICWVQGEEAAKGYILPNGVTMPLWDSENQTIYIKSVDAQGKPSMTILDYVERNATPVKEEKQPEYATKEQVDELTAQFSSINEKLSNLGSYVTKEQFDSLNGHINNLSGQVEDIENRITSFGKPQQSNNRRGNK